MTDAEAVQANPELVDLAFKVQLSNAYLFTCEVTRSPLEADDRLPALDVQEAVGVTPEGGEMGFLALLSVEVTVPIRDEGKLRINATVAGEFQSSEVLDPAFVRTFAARDGAVILWPFMRAMVAQIGSLTGVDIPTLPTLDVRATRFAVERRNAEADQPTP